MGKSKQPREFWGLDFETSGTTHENHAPIQLGICAPDGAWRSWYVKPDWYWRDQCGDKPMHGEDLCKEWDPDAFKVHGIERELLETEGKTRATISAEAVAFIVQHSKTWHGERKLVGWNVGSFDAPFLRQYFPGIALKLSYQSADLNAVCFAISEANGDGYRDIKRAAQEYGGERARVLFGTDSPDTWKLHDAGYDAIAALGAWDYLKERIAYGY